MVVFRNLEDFVTWVDTSKIKRKIMKYNDKVSTLNRRKLTEGNQFGFKLIDLFFFLHSLMISIYCEVDILEIMKLRI